MRCAQLLSAPVKLLTRYRVFQRDDRIRTTKQIILWWESRRLFFNVLIGIAGSMSSLVLFFTAILVEKMAHESIGLPDSPLFPFIWIALYAIGANICYTGGWLAELIGREVWGEKASGFGEISFTLGVIFSCGVTLLPGVLAVMGILGRFIFAQFLK